MIAQRSTTRTRFSDVADLHVASMVEAAARGEAGAWDALVDRYSSLVWSVARTHRLNEADAADVYQTTWLRLLEHVAEVREPERIGSWIATTARREAQRLRREQLRVAPTADEVLELRVAPTELEDGLEQAEESASLRRAYESLTPRCQQLLRLLMTDPAPSYEDVASSLGMPVGSIGPTRGRCLECLRRRTRMRLSAVP